MANDHAPAPAQDVRDHLGHKVRAVHTSRRAIHLTLNGQPAGALAPVGAVQRAGLTIVDAHNVRDARRAWAHVRTRAIEQGPQAITDRSGAMAVLVSPEHAQVLERGHPVLVAEELHFDGRTITDEHGQKVQPGTYAFSGGVVRVEPAPPDFD